MILGNSQAGLHQRARSNWVQPVGPSRKYNNILRPPSASNLMGYQALKQENPGYFTKEKSSHLLVSGPETRASSKNFVASAAKHH